MNTGIVYALYYDGKPFYIGQTKRRLWDRYKDHKKETFNGNNLRLYRYIRSVVDKEEDFQYLIHIKKISETTVDKLDDLEVEYIRLCKKSNIKIYNTLYN
jgi:hypothetical protein